jgi:hypothetical protein
LSNNGEWLGGINSLSWTIEIFNTSSEWVKIATIFIAYTLVSLVSLSTFSTLASLSSGHGTWMSSISFRDRVGLPDIHFSAAGSILSSSSIWVSRGWLPSSRVSFSINEFNVLWALSITVSSSELCTGFVTFIFTHTSIFLHFDKVKGTINTAWHVRDIDGEGELFVLKFEHLIFILGVHHVGSGTNVLSIGSLSD